MIGALFQRNDPAIEQVVRIHLLPAEVIDEKHPAVGFDVGRRFVEAQRGTVRQVEFIERHFAAGDDQWPSNPHPALIDVRRHALIDLDRLVALTVVDANDVIFDAHAMRDPQIAQNHAVQAAR